MPNVWSEEDSPLDLSLKKVNVLQQHPNASSCWETSDTSGRLLTQANILYDYRTLARLNESQVFNCSMPEHHFSANITPMFHFSSPTLSLFHHLFGSQSRPPPPLITTNTNQKSPLSPRLISVPFCTSSKNIDEEEDGRDGEETDEGVQESTSGDGFRTSCPDRKRVTRPLTGRYVRNGTGASPSTLMRLRQMIKNKKSCPSDPKIFKVQRPRANRKKPNSKLHAL